MAALPPWIEIPRSDLRPRAAYRVPIAYRVGIGGAALITLALFVGTLWTALYDSPPESRNSMLAIAAFLGALSACLVPMVATLGDRIEVTPEELRRIRPWSSPVALPWSRAESLRVRSLLRRIDVGSSALRRPIRLDYQLEGSEELLMIVAEQTFHLNVPRLAPQPVKATKSVRWSVEADGLASYPDLIGFADVADLRILRIGSGRTLDFAVAAQLRDGSWLPARVGAEGIFDFYWRARRAHRDWWARSGAAAPTPAPALQPQRVSGVRRWLAVLIPLATTVVIGVVSGLLRNPEVISRLVRKPSEQADVERSLELFRAHRYADLVALAEEHFARHEPSEKDLLLLHLQAASYHKLDRSDDAIRTYEKGIPVVRSLDNVHAEPYGALLYELATLYDAGGDTRRAIATLEEGLKLRPGSAMHRALLASWYQDLGDAPRAESLFREVLEAAPKGSEPYAVAARRLASGAAVAPRSYAELAPIQANLTRGRGIALVPFNDIDPRVDVAGICLALEAALWIPCGVASLPRFPEMLLLDSDRNQYRASRVLAALHSAEASITRALHAPEGGVFVLGVTSRDLFDGDANFVFASSNSDQGVGVISSYRLLEDLPRYWTPKALAGRRLSIQAISTVGTGLGFERPTSAHCPLAYPNGVEAFVLKRGDLCASEIRDRDRFLARFGNERMQHDAVRSAAVARTRHAYLLDPFDVD